MVPASLDDQDFLQATLISGGDSPACSRLYFLDNLNMRDAVRVERHEVVMATWAHAVFESAAVEWC